MSAFPQRAEASALGDVTQVVRVGSFYRRLSDLTSCRMLATRAIERTTMSQKGQR